MKPSLPQPAAAPTHERLAYKWKVLITVMIGVFMVILDSTVINVAFQTLRREFGVSLNDAQWVISVYVLSLGIVMPISGFLADRFGLKRIYLTGLALFITGSFLCGIAPSLGLLIAARALQGLGGGMAQPLGAALLFRTFPAREQGTALGLFGIALVAAPALGPILGGALVDANVWRFIFFINIPIGILGVSLGLRFLRDERPAGGVALDPLGMLLAIVGFGSVLYGATTAADHGWTSTVTLSSFALGLVALAAFVFVELKVAKEPMLNLRLYTNRTFANASAVGYVAVIALFGAEFLMPIYLQALRGRTALETGAILLALALAAGIATPTAGKLYDRIGPRLLVVTGFALLLFNTWQLSQIQADTRIEYIVFLLAVRGLGLGMSVQTTFSTALGNVPLALLPRGSSLVNSTRSLVQALGVAVLATILASSLSPVVNAQQTSALEQGMGQTAASQRFGLCETPGVAVAENLPPGAAAQVQGLPPPAQGTAKQAILTEVREACAQYVVGFERTYQVTFFAALAALVLGAFLPGWPGPWAGRAAMQHRAIGRDPGH
jgi:EmrB/QacA subfamily drug resistance transporter